MITNILSELDITRMKYDFIIITHQRCGSHLLATALNSHPDIACEGEQGDKVIKEISGRFRGMIWMCNRYYKERKIPMADKYIYLIRNPENVAVSSMMNGISRRTNPNHTAHFHGKEKTEHYILSQRQINKRIYHVKCLINGFVKRLKSHGINYLTVKYEDLTKNKEVKQIEESETKRILNFLEVDYQPLTTNLKKSRRTYEVQG